jgi:predicted TIM-barrel fold metal-dependent hydrolase
MDEHHVDYVVLSLAGPGVQAEKDGAVAQRRAHALNDFLASEIDKRPAHYGGFAHLAMHNPSQAADELERCVRDLGFQGALINGQTSTTREMSRLPARSAVMIRHSPRPRFEVGGKALVICRSWSSL